MSMYVTSGVGKVCNTTRYIFNFEQPIRPTLVGRRATVRCLKETIHSILLLTMNPYSNSFYGGCKRKNVNN